MFQTYQSVPLEIVCPCHTSLTSSSTSMVDKLTLLARLKIKSTKVSETGDYSAIALSAFLQSMSELGQVAPNMFPQPYSLASSWEHQHYSELIVMLMYSRRSLSLLLQGKLGRCLMTFLFVRFLWDFAARLFHCEPDRLEKQILEKPAYVAIKHFEDIVEERPTLASTLKDSWIESMGKLENFYE